MSGLKYVLSEVIAEMCDPDARPIYTPRLADRMAEMWALHAGDKWCEKNLKVGV